MEAWIDFIPSGIKVPFPDEEVEPAWMIEHAKEQRRQSLMRQRADLEARLAKIRAKEERARQKAEDGGSFYKKLVRRSTSHDLTFIRKTLIKFRKEGPRTSTMKAKKKKKK